MSEQAQRLLIVGAGGHAKVVIELVKAAGWDPIAAVDTFQTGTVLDVAIRGTDELIAPMWAEGDIDGAIVAIGDNRTRHRLARQIRTIGCPTPTIVHPGAILSPSARLGAGCIVMAGAIINADARIGNDCIVNSGAIVEHDCILEEAVHVAPRSVLGGSCAIARLSLFGIGASARPGVRIGAHVVVGAGSAVVSDIPDEWVVGGAPARRIEAGS